MLLFSCLNIPQNLLTAVNLFDFIFQKDYTIYWFAMENYKNELLLSRQFAIAYRTFLPMGSHMQTCGKEAVCGRKAKEQNTRRAESVGEGEGTHSRNDTVVLPRQAQNERGGSMRGMQGAYRIRALPSRKMPVQGQQKILFLL